MPVYNKRFGVMAAEARRNGSANLKIPKDIKKNNYKQGNTIMKKMLAAIFVLKLIVPTTALEHSSRSFFLNGAFGAGTWSAGEYDPGSIFLNGSLSAEWIPNCEIGLSYGIESGLNGGKTRDNIILGIPIMFRMGWYSNYLKIKDFDIFILVKIGWAFGLWGFELDEFSTPSGIVGGINFGGRRMFTKRLGIYAEMGYNYYGLARNSNYPEYPLGYGSGKVYTSAGLSFSP